MSAALAWYPSRGRCELSKCGRYAVVPLLRVEDSATIGYDSYYRKSQAPVWYLQSFRRHHIGRSRFMQNAKALCQEHSEVE